MARLSEKIDTLLDKGGQVNLSEWMRSVRRTSARIGLAVSGDLTSALASLEDEQQTVEDLIDFALSPLYQRLREERGLALSRS